MDFFARLNNGLQNNANYINSNSRKKSFFSFGFASNALKKKELKEDTYQNSQTVDKLGLIPNSAHSDSISINVFDDELALNYPVRFISKYLNSSVINNAINTNPQIAKILKEEGLTLDYNLDNVRSIVMSHLIPTTKKAQEIYLKMGHSKNEQNYILLTQAALLHDIGKIFIPSSILNKKGMLSLKERRIIELHNKLSYEILKTTSVNPKVASLTYEHHDYDDKLVKNQENQALMIADVYSALKEDRPYKKPISDLCARTILYDMGTKGKLDSRYLSYV